MQTLRKAIVLFLALTVVVGILYPLAVTGLAMLVFPEQSSGSLIYDRDGRLAGSRLIGQPFADPGHFWSRPSATSDPPYNSLASGGSNLGPTNADLLRQFRERVEKLRASGMQGPIPADLVMASGSGLDPDITLEAALAQIPRIARVRHLPEAELRGLVLRQARGKPWNPLGVPRVNVLELNLRLGTLR